MALRSMALRSMALWSGDHDHPQRRPAARCGRVRGDLRAIRLPLGDFLRDPTADARGDRRAHPGRSRVGGGRARRGPRGLRLRLAPPGASRLPLGGGCGRLRRRPAPPIGGRAGAVHSAVRAAAEHRPVDAVRGCHPAQRLEQRPAPGDGVPPRGHLQTDRLEGRGLARCRLVAAGSAPGRAGTAGRARGRDGCGSGERMRFQRLLGPAAKVWSITWIALMAVGAASAEAISVSSNWAGYIASPSAGVGSRFERVSGTWTIPNATCSAGRESYSAVWVGLGGASEDSPALEQIGTDADCTSSGAAGYSSWYELVPAVPVELRLEVHPGD